jgi:hypothetical protein
VQHPQFRELGVKIDDRDHGSVSMYSRPGIARSIAMHCDFTDRQNRYPAIRRRIMGGGSRDPPEQLRARHHLLFPREPDIGEQTVIEPREGVNLPSPRMPRSHPLAGAAAETDHFLPRDIGDCGLSANQSEHLESSLAQFVFTEFGDT